MKYDYDDKGIIFNYFQLAIILLFLLPYTYSSLVSSKRADEDYLSSDPRMQKKIDILNKNKKRNTKKQIFLALAWLYTAYVFKNAATNILEEVLWDPYGILEVDTNADQRTIKRAFRKLAQKWHPDKVDKELRDEAEAKYVDISKAYKTLTTEDARALFDEFGHPDGKQAMSHGIALPAWLVEKDNHALVLLVYGLIFGVALPMYVARWWGSSKNFTKDRIMHQTMGNFYRDLGDNTNAKGVLELLTAAEEFQELCQEGSADKAAVDELATKVKQELQSRFSEPFAKSKKYSTLPWAHKVSVLIHSHLLRIHVSDPKLEEKRNFVVAKCGHLVTGLLQISTSRNWLNTAIHVIEVSQLIIQGLYFGQHGVSQLPYLDDPEILKHFKNKKRNVSTIRDLMQMEKEDRASLLRSLDESQIKAIEKTATAYPLLRVEKAKFSVLGEKAIIPGAIVTLIVKLKFLTVEELIESKRRGSEMALVDELTEEDTAEPEKKWWKSKENRAQFAHCPYYPEHKRPTWWVMLGNPAGSRLITLTKVTMVKKNEAIARLQFQAPPNTGKWNFKVFCKSDSYYGCDAEVPVDLTVLPHSASPLEEVDDDISEPEFDTLAGQMQTLKEKGPRGLYDDSSDEDEDSG